MSKTPIEGTLWFLEKFWYAASYCNAITTTGLPCRNYRMFKRNRNLSGAGAEHPMHRCCWRHRDLISAGKPVKLYEQERFVRDHES